MLEEMLKGANVVISGDSGKLCSELFFQAFVRKIEGKSGERLASF